MAAHSNGQVIIYCAAVVSSFFFFPRLFSAVGDVTLIANLECMSEMCCTRLAETYRTQNNYAKIVICEPSHNSVALYLRN